MGFKKILFGEKVPDKDDPKYKERYERDVAAGKSFAQTLHLDKGAACVQRLPLSTQSCSWHSFPLSCSSV